MKFEDSDRGHAYCVAEVNSGHHPHATGPIRESQARWIFDISGMVQGYLIGTNAEGTTTSAKCRKNNDESEGICMWANRPSIKEKPSTFENCYEAQLHNFALRVSTIGHRFQAGKPDTLKARTSSEQREKLIDCWSHATET